jgi:hypothetical protein
LYNLSALPSTDRRYATAEGDIRQHCINNEDWDYDWVFYDGRFGLQNSDERLLEFLASMLHPVVRTDTAEIQQLLTHFNAALKPDGYQIVKTGEISGRAVYGHRRTDAFHGDEPVLALDERPPLTEPEVLHEHLARIGRSVRTDPAAAIGSCKELVESLCKIILERSGVPYPASDDLPSLYRRAADLLRLKAEAVPASAKGSETAQKILRTLSTTVQALAELRNELGIGHGRSSTSGAQTRHARLALNSTVTVTEFLLDTWQERVESGEITLVS